MPRAEFRDLFLRFYSTLEALGVDYFAYGGVSVAFWGDPRETQDVDAVAVLEPEETGPLLQGLAAAGFNIPPRQAVTFPIDGWVRAQFQGRFADVALGRTPFDRSALSRRSRFTVHGLPIWTVSAEDLVLYKLTAYRFKDLADVEVVLLRQRRSLDLAYLKFWADEIARRTGKFEVPQKLESLLDTTTRPT
ncbi:MAG: hypothetical protein HYZ53_07450 [Planctomycetes bacterium]|nr:hypothetical protein [Planctomycetota bacterium]